MKSIPKNQLTNPNYYASLVIFQKFKEKIKKIIHTPCGAFYYICTLILKCNPNFNFEVFLYHGTNVGASSPKSKK